MHNKLLILGTGGSGKTTLGKRIEKILRIKRKSIDDLRYSKDFTISFSNKMANYNLKRFLKKNKWILDGVYAKNYILPAIQKADTIIVLKSTRMKLIFRIIRREISVRKKYKRRPLSDLIKLLYWSQKFKNHNEKNPDYSKEEYRKRLVYLKNHYEINNFLKSLK